MDNSWDQGAFEAADHHRRIEAEDSQVVVGWEACGCSVLTCQNANLSPTSIMHSCWTNSMPIWTKSSHNCLSKGCSSIKATCRWTMPKSINCATIKHIHQMWTHSTIIYPQTSKVHSFHLNKGTVVEAEVFLEEYMA